MFFLSVWDDITFTINGAWRSLVLSLCETVYKLIIFCFNVFDKIGTAKLLDSETVNILYEKVGLILGIYMIFRLTFVAIQYVVDPDAMTDKNKGASKLLTKAIIVIVLLGITPFIFDMAYKLQSMIATENIIGKLILSSDEKLNTSADGTSFGNELSWYLFSAFYDNSEISSTTSCQELDRGLIEVDFLRNGSLKYAYNCINETFTYQDDEGNEVEDFIIVFDGLLALIAGIVMLWIIIMYTISVGFRLIQLAFLELIAPLPIMMYLEPKDDGPFQKWIKLCTSCYLDYFIRTIIIYFICFLIQKIMDMDTSYFFTTLGETTDKEYCYIVIIIIFGLLMFAKKLPDLLKEVLPGGRNSFSDYGFSFKKRADNMLGGSYINKGYDKLKGFAGNTAKAIGLMPLSGVKRTITGIDSAAHGKGFWNGFWKNPSKVGQWINKQRETLTPEGYKTSQERREGRESVSEIDTRWGRGAKLINKLIKTGRFGKQGEASGWDKALDGETKENYKLLFKSEEFIKSKMAVDRASKTEEKLRYIQQAINSGSTENYTFNGVTYSRANAEKLAEDLDKAQKTLSGVKEVHTEMSKQYQDDARVEQDFKFIKNNSINPANIKQNVNNVEEKAIDEALRRML